MCFKDRSDRLALAWLTGSSTKEACEVLSCAPVTFFCFVFAFWFQRHRVLACDLSPAVFLYAEQYIFVCQSCPVWAHLVPWAIRAFTAMCSEKWAIVLECSWKPSCVELLILSSLYLCKFQAFPCWCPESELRGELKMDLNTWNQKSRWKIQMELLLLL